MNSNLNEDEVAYAPTSALGRAGSLVPALVNWPIDPEPIGR